MYDRPFSSYKMPPRKARKVKQLVFLFLQARDNMIMSPFNISSFHKIR